MEKGKNLKGKKNNKKQLKHSNVLFVLVSKTTTSPPLSKAITIIKIKTIENKKVKIVKIKKNVLEIREITNIVRHKGF